MSAPSSAASSAASSVPCGAHHLAVEAEADPNVLLRLMEPFVIHGVLPHAMACTAGAESLHAEFRFRAPDAIAERLRARLDAMVPVRCAMLSCDTSGDMVRPAVAA